MPSHLHPRSRTTTSLFGLTFAASFLVVGLPHIVPCPVPRTQFADTEITEDGKRRRRRRVSVENPDAGSSLSPSHTAVEQDVAMTEEERDALTKKAHECPVPKPGGRIGELLGFIKDERKQSKSLQVDVEPRVTFHGIAFFTNLAAGLALVALLALGVWVNVNRFIVGDESTHGWKAVKLDTTSWNIACTVVGTAVGILAAVAFSNQDDVITRSELAHHRGVVAIFLRPLTVKRGLEQIYSLQMPWERTILVFPTVVTALMSATVVALFGIHASQQEIINPLSSIPLAELNSSVFENDREGAVFANGSPTSSSVTGQLSGFLYKAAYITGRKIRAKYNPYDPYIAYLPEQGPLGDTTYRVLNTGGVGLNASSYLQYSGIPSGFSMPAAFEFNELRATVYGTHVNVSCRNVTSAYTISSNEIEQITLVFASKPNSPNITLFGNLDGHSILTTLAIGSAVTLDPDTAEPVHTLVIPEFITQSALVLECSYSGREYLAEVSIASPTSSLLIEREVDQGPLIGPLIKQRRGKRGNLARGFIDSEYNADGFNNTGMASALETVIAHVGEAYFSVLRQQAERSNVVRGDPDASYPSELRLYVTVSRLGGAQYGWLAVLGILLLVSFVGTARTCVGRRAVGFEAQDAVKLLARLLDEPIGVKTRVWYRDRLVVLGSGRGGGLNEAKNESSPDPVPHEPPNSAAIKKGAKEAQNHHQISLDTSGSQPVLNVTEDASGHPWASHLNPENSGHTTFQSPSFGVSIQT
ncbi:MAG: hypothetical protein Q9173_006518 [Seirophora scorigena]